MTTAHRVFAALALATGASALAAPSAGAAPVEAPQIPSVMNELDTLSADSVGPEHRENVPAPSEQLAGLNRLAGVPNDLDPLTGQLAPVTGLVGA
ncbi:hypothetical protein J7E88_24970 [Streptomyces sp. ISL-10]|uniref:hypothetical protein n=1 Tax=Streptomyces sp. ISL-10 TaxID=2819172 RepID=UPI001BEC031D|nr:hypothetical protein [Streptomyces sp. ISL-10]MBT2368488.1 hypothetical protein [Streptomyces sp. ISL-10]